jgi:hypothetical protein
MAPKMSIVSEAVSSFSSTHTLWAGLTNEENSNKLDRPDGTRVQSFLFSSLFPESSLARPKYQQPIAANSIDRT